MIDTQDDFNQALCMFLSRATTPYHAVALTVSRLREAGFSQLAQDKPWTLEPGGGYFLVHNHGSIVAFRYGREAGPEQGVRMVGAHTDSPCLMVKPSPEIESEGLFQLGVQVYGGALLNPWFDRDLSLAGRVSYLCPRGTLRAALVDFRDAIATIPSLAIHLDSDANRKREVNAQTAIVPVLCQAASEGMSLREMLAMQIRKEHSGAEIEQILDFELSFYDTQPPAVIGLRKQYIASARLDNLLSCFTGLEALLQSDASQTTLLVCNDHEEVGSVSASGASGPLLASCLQRLAGGTEAHAALVEHSFMVSTDNAHAVHPNFASRHDGNHGPRMNEGPVIKVNASQRYATNSETSGLFRMLAARESVPVQSFVVRNDMRCGSTIGPLTAAVTGVKTLDVGVPTLGMHSVRELAGVEDAWSLCRILRGFYNYAGPLSAA
ncbi:M18 family aminopeptidase [Halioglobus sp.]|nr:M18 family aminopeptidase [Halioglobus sp.]